MKKIIFVLFLATIFMPVASSANGSYSECAWRTYLNLSPIEHFTESFFGRCVNELIEDRYIVLSECKQDITWYKTLDNKTKTCCLLHGYLTNTIKTKLLRKMFSSILYSIEAPIYDGTRWHYGARTKCYDPVTASLLTHILLRKTNDNKEMIEIAEWGNVVANATAETPYYKCLSKSDEAYIHAKKGRMKDAAILLQNALSELNAYEKYKEEDLLASSNFFRAFVQLEILKDMKQIGICNDEDKDIAKAVSNIETFPLLKKSLEGIYEKNK